MADGTQPARKLPPLDVRAAVRVGTLNRERRTVDVVWTTTAPVLRGYWDQYYEELSLDPKHVRMGRLTSGRAPLLNNHSRYDMRDVIGVVEAAAVDGKQGTATVRFARAEDDPEADRIFRKIADGIIGNVSVGYRVYRYEKTSGGEGEIPTYRAVDWEPFEISAVPVGADAAAAFRGADGMSMNDVTITTRQESRAMDEELNAADATEEAPVNLTDPQAQAATRAERRRVTEIRKIVGRAKLDAAFESRLIDGGTSLDEARKLVLDELAKRDASHPIDGHVRVSMGDSDSQTRAEAIGEAIYARVTPDHKPSDHARQFVGLPLVEIARECLRNAGIRTFGMGSLKIIERAIHTTSDFPIALGDAVGRTLLRGYETADPGAVRVGRRVMMPDFRTRTRIQIGEAPRLLKVHEAGEFTHGTIPEAKEAYGLATYGRIFSISRQALVNDDLGVFDDLPRRFGVEARELESQLVVELITANAGVGPTMDDDKALFHADHRNLASEGAAPSVEALGDARTAMRTQQGLTGRAVNFVPKYLLVPAALETQAEKILAQIAAADTDKVNPFSGRLEPVVDPRLDAISTTRWYVVADPGRYDGMEVAYLESVPGPWTDIRYGFEVDGMEVKVRHDFGAGFVEHRSWYMNPGAEGGEE
ncbi:MAG: prohead protease/major capsid protein fusion protein [Alphaproteobacteria bacterium]